jgi:hypothetical protein
MLVSEVIERSYNTWLYPSGVNRPSYDKLTAGVDGSTLSIPLAGRVQNVPADSVLEIDSEQILVDSVSGTTVTAKERGWLETGAAAHSTGAIVWVDPEYTRKSIFNALITIMGLLYPAGVYARAVDTTQVFSYTAPTLSLPTGGRRVITILAKSTGSVVRWSPLRPETDYYERREFDPTEYELVRGGDNGAALRVVYAADFTLPTAETDDLSTLAFPMPATLQPHLPMAIAGHLLQGKEVPRVQIEEIRRQLASQGIQVGAALNVGQGLLNGFMARYAAAERDRLAEQDGAGDGIVTVRR